MTPELAAFSDWTLALLPRLFLYPGGLWLLLSLFVLRLAAGGWRSPSPRILLDDLSRSNLLSIAVGWAAISLLPLPGASLLPFPVDSFVLVALPLASLLLDRTGENKAVIHVMMGVLITFDLLLPAVAGRTLLVTDTGMTVASVAALLSILIGLLALGWANGSLTGDVRWLVWLGMGIAMLLHSMIATSGIGWYSAAIACALFLLGVVVLHIGPHWPQQKERVCRWAAAIAPLPGLLGLLAVLLALR